MVLPRSCCNSAQIQGGHLEGPGKGQKGISIMTAVSKRQNKKQNRQAQHKERRIFGTFFVYEQPLFLSFPKYVTRSRTSTSNWALQSFLIWPPSLKRPAGGCHRCAAPDRGDGQAQSSSSNLETPGP